MQPERPSAGHSIPAGSSQLHTGSTWEGKGRDALSVRPSPRFPPRSPHPAARVPAKDWLSVSPAVFPLRGWEAETCCNTPDEAAPGAFPDGNLAAEPALGPHPAQACKALQPRQEHACVECCRPCSGPPFTPFPGAAGALAFRARCCEGKLRHWSSPALSCGGVGRGRRDALCGAEHTTED